MAVSVLGFSVPTFWVGIDPDPTSSPCISAGCRPDSRGETVMLFGVEWSFLTLDGWSTSSCPR